MQLTVVLTAVFCHLAAAGELRKFAKGYVRAARPQAFGVERITKEDKDTAPDAVDWVAKGATTPVKDQGGCGDCWAFSTTEGVESAVYMATGTLMGLSEQQVTSCDTVDHGCKGGDPANGLAYLKQAGGIDSQSNYPDTSPADGVTGDCKWSGHKAAVVTGYSYAIPPCNSAPCDNQDEEALAAAVAKYGPLSMCIDAGPWNNTQGWKSYDVVEFPDCSSDPDKMDHCVQLVGYDKSASKPYWKIRNTWTDQWGEDGFIRLPFGKNTCGLANEVFIIQATSATASMPAVVV